MSKIPRTPTEEIADTRTIALVAATILASQRYGLSVINEDDIEQSVTLAESIFARAQGGESADDGDDQ